MTSYLYLCLGLIGLGLIISFIWRFASRRYSLPCPSWLGWMLENPLTESGRWQTAVSRLDLRPGMKVLDVGCGPGRLTIPVARVLGADGQVVAIDIQPAMLRRAKQRAEAAGLNNIHFRQVAAGQGHLEKTRYDRALLVTVLGEIQNREAALKEIFNALKPGGMLSVSEVIFDPHFQSRGTILRLAGAVGFQDKQFFGNRFAFTLNLEKPSTK
jgi:ubiquinone/menaquinone biosynthesis C-methylase UbiE